jgi:acyl-lipid omega-6 desaturase (Delta-12 desaturase)
MQPPSDDRVRDPRASTLSEPDHGSGITRASQRRAVRRFRESSDAAAAALCTFDVMLFVAGLGTVILVPNGLVKWIASVVLGLSVARLFVLGHDACHQCLFTGRMLNRSIGRALFLPSLTPFSLWEVGHNLGHHVYTNLRGFDYVWAPLSPEEFDAMPSWRQRLERFYRSGWGYGAYYLLELWWKKLFFASRREIASQRAAFFWDSLLVSAFACAWIGVLVLAAIATKQSSIQLVLLGFVVPFVLWNCIMGTVIYFHHTHPQLIWFDDLDRWEASRDSGCNTVHIQFRGRMGRVLNNIMEHPAHHLDVRIPLYRLEAAQRALGATNVPRQRFSIAFALECVSHCKLYDFAAMRWVGFDGRESPIPLTVQAADSFRDRDRTFSNSCAINRIRKD